MLGSSFVASVAAFFALMLLPTTFTSTLPLDWRTRLLARRYGSTERMALAVMKEPLYVTLAIAGSAIAGTLLVVLLIVARSGSGTWRARLGLVRCRLPARDFLLLVVAGLGAMFVIGNLLISALQHLRLLPPIGAGRAMLPQALLAAPPALKVVLVVAASLLTGVYEELLFRGYLQRGLLACWRPVAALMVTACLFALMHGDLTYAVLVLPIGLWIGYLAWRADSLLPSMVCHVCGNGIGLTSLAVFGTRLTTSMRSFEQVLVGAHLLWPFTLAIVLASALLLWLGVRRVEQRIR